MVTVAGVGESVLWQITPDKTARDKLNICSTTEYLIGTTEGFSLSVILLKTRSAESAHKPDCIDSIKLAYNDFVLAGAKSQGAKLRFTDPDMPVATRMPATRAGSESVTCRFGLQHDYSV